MGNDFSLFSSKNQHVSFSGACAGNDDDDDDVDDVDDDDNNNADADGEDDGDDCSVMSHVSKYVYINKFIQRCTLIQVLAFSQTLKCL